MPIKTIIRRLAAPFRKNRLDKALNEEIQFHLEMETAENIRGGMTPEEARHAALRKFGGVEQAKEAYRRQSAFGWLEDLIQDGRYAVRSLLRNPGYSLLAILSLALGIGVNTAVFTLLRQTLLQPLPYPEPAQLFHLYETMTWQGYSSRGGVSVPNLQDWRRQNTVFESIGAFGVGGANLSTDVAASVVAATRVDGELFKVLGVKPLAGRVVQAEDCERGKMPVAVLSHGLWVDLFGTDRSAIGKSIRLNGATATVVGIMPESFKFPARSPSRIWIPMIYQQTQIEERGTHWLEVVGRLKEGVSALAAQQDMNRVARNLEAAYRQNATRGVRLEPLYVASVREIAAAMIILTGAVVFILILACVNVAIMTLARGFSRRRELAVRLSVGASRFRIVRLLVGEALLLAFAGGVCGLAVADWSLQAIHSTPYNPLRFTETVQLDSVTLGYCSLIALLSAGLAGLWPALRASRVDLQTSLKEGGSSGSNPGRPGRSKLLIVEVALALVLVLGATLLVKSLGRLAEFDLGFKTENVITMRVALPDARFEPGTSAGFFDRLLDRVEGLPGIIHAGVINILPITPVHSNMSVSIEGRPLDRPGHEPAAEHRVVSPGYFHAMGIPVVRGRHFTMKDWKDRTRTVMINRQMAERYWPGENPVGKRLAGGSRPGPDRWLTIVGVAGNVRDTGIYRSVPTVMYEPMTQFTRNTTTVSLVVRSTLRTDAVESSIRRELSELDPDAVLHMVKPMEQVVEDATSGTRFLALLLSLFGLLAVALAIVGVYGVTSFQAGRRTHEIGVRIAMGATRTGILRMIIGTSVNQSVIGIALGLVWALSLNRIIRNYTIGIGLVDAITYLQAIATIVVIASAASFIPAWRASRIQPLDALREE